MVWGGMGGCGGIIRVRGAAGAAGNIKGTSKQGGGSGINGNSLVVALWFVRFCFDCFSVGCSCDADWPLWPLRTHLRAITGRQ